MRSAENRDAFTVLVYSILFLFFLQLITDFIAGLYANGVMVGKIPPEMPVVALLLSPFLLLLFGRGLPTTALIVLGELVLLSRAVEVVLPTTRNQLLIAGIGTGLFLFLFPALLWNQGQKRNKGAGSLMAAGLVLALALSIMFRSLGSTIDISNEGGFRLMTWFLAIGAAVLIPNVIRFQPQPEESPSVAIRNSGWGKVTLLAIGITSVFTLLYFAFTSPTVISRWTESSYLLVLSVALVALMLFAWLLAIGKNVLERISKGLVLFLTFVFALAFTLTLWASQVNLPKSPSAYPVTDPEVSSLWVIALLLMLVLFPILFLDYGLLVEEVILGRPSIRKLGLGFGVASLLMLILVLSNVFTSVWAYIDPFLEPFFRYKFWFYHFIAVALLTLSMLAVGNKAVELSAKTASNNIGRGFGILITAIGIIALAVAILSSPQSETPREPNNRLKIAGYNIQQGYDINGQRSHQEQCAVLKEIDADIIGLSETDTARIAGGNFDAPRYLAECLEKDSYIGPKTGTGTFGYALLSEYPIKNAVTDHLFSGPEFPSVRDNDNTSEGDQVAVISGKTIVGNKTFNIFVNHFDSYPPREQPEGFLKLVEGLENVIAIGDYNCEPNTECFAIITQVLEHCAVTGAEVEATQEKVDHIFVSPGLQCQNFTYIESPASDHPVVVAEIVW